MPRKHTVNCSINQEQTVEVWKDALGFEGLYQVSNIGGFKSLPHITIGKNGIAYRRPGKIARSTPGKYGHCYMRLYKEGKLHIKGLHVLVLETFVGSCPNGMECRHLDGDATNNRVENLAWGTHADNMRDRIKHGTTNHGVKSHLTKDGLNDKIVTKLIRTWETGKYDTRDLMKMFGLSYGTVWTITRGRTWKHIKRMGQPYSKKRSKKGRVDPYPNTVLLGVPGVGL